MDNFQGQSLEAGAWLAAIVEGSEDAIVSQNLAGTILSWNAGAQKLFGYSPPEAIGRPITLIIPDNLLHEEATIVADLRAGLHIDHFETVRRRKDGSFVDVSLSVAPVRDHQGELVGASKTARDITPSRQMIEQQRLILNEMNHRIKNLFALATGLVALCRREAETADALAHDLQSRLLALARAHDTILRPDSASGQIDATSLHDLLLTILHPYEGRSGPRIEVNGEDLQVGPRSLSSVALLLHELATNSAKYGALRSVSGVVAVITESLGDDVRLRWSETGQGRMLSPPESIGFGSHLEAMAVRALDGSINRDWQSDRLLVELRLGKETLKH